MTKAEAFELVWELTKEVFSLSGKYDVESRLQRHVVSIARKQDGLLVPVISKQNLITNKLATGRDKDRLDVENLRSSQ